MKDPGPAQRALRKIPELAHIAAAVWRRFDALCSMHACRKGDVIFREGHPSFGMYFLSSGRVKIVKAETGRRFHITRVVSAPDLLGDRAFLAGQPYLGSAEAMEESVVGFLEAEHFRNLFLKDPRVGFALARRFALELGQAEEKMLGLAVRTIRERLAKYLLDHLGARAAGKPARVTLSESRAELAEILGTTPEAVSRGLGEFRDQGWVVVEDHAVLVRDQESLRQVAGLS